MATMVAISMATKGSPRKLKTTETGCSAGRTTPQTESQTMKSRGIRMMATMVAKGGRLASSMSDWLEIRSGTGTIYFLPQKEPHSGPATIMATVPQKMPMRMTQPRSTPSIEATRMGPGVGGMKAWPTARPASRGMA